MSNLVLVLHPTSMRSLPARNLPHIQSKPAAFKCPVRLRGLSLLLACAALFLVPVAHAADQPPVIICGVDTISANVGQTVGNAVGGYDPDGWIETAVINWGDGTTNSTSMSNYLAGSCSPTAYNWLVPPTFGAIFYHAYKAPGFYTVMLTLVDNGGVSTSETFVTTINDPSYGSGGHISVRV